MNVLNDTLSANSSLVRFLVPEEELSTQARFFPIKSINIHASPTHNHYNHSHMHTSPYYHHDLPVYDVILPYNVTHNHTVWFPDGSNYTFNHTVLVPGHEHRLVASPGGGHHGGGYHGGGHHGGGKHGGGQHGVPHHTAGHQTAALGHHGGGGYGGGGYGGGGYGGGGYGGEGYGGGGFGGLGHGGVGHGAGIIPGIGAALSGWYQLNMGFIGIGALVVVAIIASRNFFPNWLQYKSFYGGSDGYDYEFYEVPAYESGGGGGYGGYNGYRRLSWYDEWHKYWYGKDGDDYRRDNKNYYRQRRKYKRSLQSNFRATEYRNVENIPLSKKKFVLSVKSENSSHVVSVERKHRFTVPENRTFSRNLLLNKTDPYNKNNKYNNTFSEDHGEVQTLPRRPPTGKLLEAAHCAFRLLCEITKQKKKLLSKEEWKIFSSIRFSDLQLHEFSPGLALLPEASITSDYLAATHLGAEGYQCERLLGSCPLTTDQINKATGKLNNIQFSRSTNFTVNSTE